MRDLLRDLERGHRQGKRAALARVVDIEGSGPRGPGAAMAVSEDGEVVGSVSGGCVEGAVVEEAMAVLAGKPPRIATFGYSDDDASEGGLSSGGPVKHYLEEPEWGAGAAVARDRPPQAVVA